jgi:transposase
VRQDHPLRAIRLMVDEVLAPLSGRFDRMYASAGRPSIPPEKLLRAQSLQMLYSIWWRRSITACCFAGLWD